MIEVMLFFLTPVLLGAAAHIYDTDSRIRRLLLKGYAWKEVELLRVMFWIAHQPVMGWVWFRKPFYWLFAHFLGTRGVVCQAATLKETEAFIDMLDDRHAMAVGPCRCRIGNSNCDHEVVNDIVITETASIWYKELFPEDYRIITKEEAKEICRRSRRDGMIQCIDRHMYFKGSENHFVICNCCKCSCVPILAYRIFKDEPYSFFPSESVAVLDPKRCIACGTCVTACPFDERHLTDDGGMIVIENCQGCGLCVDVCEHGAGMMIPRLDAAPSGVEIQTISN